MYHETSMAAWIGFVVFILALLLLDLGVFHKKSHTVSFKESIIWSIVWIGLAMAFAGLMYFWKGPEDTLLFLTGYVIEKSLSVDNLFVFLLIFSFFKVPNEYQHKVLFYGILGALIMRAVFIGAGIAIINQFTWVMYVFGAFLVYSGVKMLMPQDENVDLNDSFIVKWTKKFMPTTPDYVGDKFFHRINGVLHVTPLFLTLVFVEFSDLVFAVDSIPAIIGITNDPFLVFTSNVFAILGLRSLYFALKGVADIFHYLKYGLAIILMFIGVKMLLLYWKFHVPVPVTMSVIFGIITVSIILSLWSNARTKKKALDVSK